MNLQFNFYFSSPREPGEIYVKRLAKGPGRRVEYKDGTQYIVPENHYWMLAGMLNLSQ